MKAPKKLNREFVKTAEQIEEEDVCAYISPHHNDGNVRATIGFKINGVWYYADGYEFALSRFERRDA